MFSLVGASGWGEFLEGCNEGDHRSISCFELVGEDLEVLETWIVGYRKHLWHWKVRIASLGYVALDCRFGLAVEIGWVRVLLVVWEDSERAV